MGRGFEHILQTQWEKSRKKPHVAQHTVERCYASSVVVDLLDFSSGVEQLGAS